MMKMMTLEKMGDFMTSMPEGFMESINAQLIIKK